MNFKMKLKLKTTASNPAEALEIAIKLLDDAKERVRVAMNDCRDGFALGAPMPLVGDRVGQLSLSYTDPEAANAKLREKISKLEDEFLPEDRRA